MVSLKHALITVVLCVCPDKGASHAALSRWYSGAETAVRSPGQLVPRKGLQGKVGRGDAKPRHLSFTARVGL